MEAKVNQIKSELGGGGGAVLLDLTSPEPANLFIRRELTLKSRDWDMEANLQPYGVLMSLQSGVLAETCKPATEGSKIIG